MLRNRYRPMKPLGAGRFGKNYLAQDIESKDIEKLNEKCIIKQFTPQVEGTVALNKATELFEQEAKRLQQLGEYPQIPTLLDYFKADSHLYLVQQFVDGANLLEELLQQGTFSQEKIQNLLEDLLNILKVVHQHKVIHRDIKPENIIRSSDNHKVVLIEFGISEELTKTVIKVQGSTISSFGYAPLEQMQGGEAYPSSDLFSLGVTCFHLLSGIDPSKLWIAQGYSWVQSWEEHLQQRVSQRLKKIIDQLLLVDYQRRYQSVEEVLQDLNLLSQPKKTQNAEAYYNEGIEKYNKKDYQKAIEDFNQAIKINPKYPDAYLKQGNARYYLGAYQQAIENYNQLIKISPNCVEAYNSRGCTHYSLGDAQAAIEDFTQAIKINPNYAKAYSNRGNIRTELGDYQAAIEDCNQAIKINPNHGMAYYNRGNARSDLGDYQEAIEDYNQAIKINPDDANAYFNRGLASDKLGDKQAAIEDFTQVIKINPDNACAYLKRGNVRGKLGNYQVAIEDYTKAIKINPDNAYTYYNRGLFRSELGDFQDAIKDFRKAADLHEQQGKESEYQDALRRMQEAIAELF